MKILINLLPEDKKNEIKRRKRLRVIIWQELLILFILLIFVGIVICTNFILKVQVSSLDEINAFEQSHPSYRELQSYEDEFKQVNSKISLLYSIRKNNLHWLNTLYALDSIVPKEILLTDLITKDYRMSIAGIATTRDELLKFKETINNSDCFKDAEVPLSNLVYKENVNFQIDFNIADDCLKDNLSAKKVDNLIKDPINKNEANLE